MKVFDIDGTLTYGYDDIEEKTGLKSYTFWDIITLGFAESQDEMETTIRDWNLLMTVELNSRGSSVKMIEQAVKKFRNNIAPEHLRSKPKKLTLKFLRLTNASCR